MKTNKFIKIFSVFAVVLLFAACAKKYTTDNVTEKIVEPHYPKIVLNGDQFVSVPVSATGQYTDAGAIGINDNDNSQTNLEPLTNDVDLTTPGFYTVIYEFRNTDGYTTTATRFILVTNVDASLDYSGDYVRTVNGQAMSVTKVATGLYKTDNVGGVAGIPDYVFDVYFGQIDDTTLSVPLQPTPLGNLYCVSSFIYPTSSDTTIKWGVRNPSFGTAVRTFVKDEG